MVGVFTNRYEILIVGLDEHDDPLDVDGTLFGPDSGRHMKDYERINLDPEDGTVVQVQTGNVMRSF